MANTWRNWNPCVLLVGMQNAKAAMQNSILKILKIELLYDPARPPLDIYSKELKSGSQRDISTPMLIAALFTIATMWKQAKCPSDE